MACKSETLRTSIQQFHRYFRRTATVKATELKGELLMQKKEKSQYGLGRQVKAMIRDCTVQLTIFADGEPCIKPLWIFKAQDKELQTEKRGSMIQESWSSSERTRGATRKSSSSGATSKVQPLDVTFNAEFKKSVDRLRLD